MQSWVLLSHFKQSSKSETLHYWTIKSWAHCFPSGCQSSFRLQRQTGLFFFHPSLQVSLCIFHPAIHPLTYTAFTYVASSNVHVQTLESNPESSTSPRNQMCGLVHHVKSPGCNHVIQSGANTHRAHFHHVSLQRGLYPKHYVCLLCALRGRKVLKFVDSSSYVWVCVLFCVFWEEE